MKAIIRLLKATWRHPENDQLNDSTFCTSCVDRLLRSDDRKQFVESFGSIAGEELFQQFTQLKGKICLIQLPDHLLYSDLLM